MIKSFDVRVYLPHYEDKYLWKVYFGKTVPRVGDMLWVANGNWDISSVSWRPLHTTKETSNELVAVCYIHFGRESEDAYWAKEDFWINNGFVMREDQDGHL